MIVRVGRRPVLRAGLRQAIGDDILARSRLRHPVRRPRQSAQSAAAVGWGFIVICDCTQSARAQRRDGGRKGGKEALARCTQRQQTADSRRHARWADADDGFSKQEWNPAQPIVWQQVDCARVAKPFEVLAGFLASSAGGLLFQGVKARGS